MSVSDTNNARTARRWLRFSLRGLLIASTLMGAIVGWLVGKWKSTNDRRQAIQNIAALDGFVVSSSGHIFGSYAQNAGLHVTELDDFDIWSEVVSVHIGSFRKPAENADLACLAELPEIELLNLYGVNITNDGLVHLSHLSKLRRLSLKNTSVTPHGLSVYENLRNLELLGLWEASVTDSTLQCLDALPGLKHLQIIQAPNVTDSALRNLSNLTNLRRLDIFRTPINGSGFAHIRSLRLGQLRLNGTSIDNSCVVHLCQLTGLVCGKYLWLAV